MKAWGEYRQDGGTMSFQHWLERVVDLETENEKGSPFKKDGGAGPWKQEQKPVTRRTS